LEPYFREKARKRQLAQLKQFKNKENRLGKFSKTEEPIHVREKVAEALGISGKQWDKIKKIFENEEKYPDIVKKVDSGEYTVHEAFEEIRKREKQVQEQVEKKEQKPSKKEEDNSEITNTYPSRFSSVFFSLKYFD